MKLFWDNMLHSTYALTKNTLPYILIGAQNSLKSEIRSKKIHTGKKLW